MNVVEKKQSWEKGEEGDNQEENQSCEGQPKRCKFLAKKNKLVYVDGLTGKPNKKN